MKERKRTEDEMKPQHKPTFIIQKRQRAERGRKTYE